MRLVVAGLAVLTVAVVAGSSGAGGAPRGTQVAFASQEHASFDHYRGRYELRLGEAADLLGSATR
jgi:hypothetical protein